MPRVPIAFTTQRRPTPHGHRWYATVNGVEIMHPRLDVVARMASEIAYPPQKAALRENSGELACK